MKIQQTLSFKQTVKPLHKNQKADLNAAIKVILSNPQVGQQRKGELSEVRVYKFKMTHLLTLLAYTWEAKQNLITLLKLGSHENFYRELKHK